MPFATCSVPQSFHAHNCADEYAGYATLGMGALNLGSTIVSVALVERYGRRTLHLTGLVIMLVNMIFLFLSMALQVHTCVAHLRASLSPLRALQKNHFEWASGLCVLFTLLYVAGFATGPGSIPWFFVSELFLDESRGTANSIAVAANWLASFSVGMCFLPIKVSRVRFRSASADSDIYGKKCMEIENLCRT